MKLKYLLIVLIVTLFTNLYAQSAQTDSDLFFSGTDKNSDFNVTLPENSFSAKGIQYGAILSPVCIFDDRSDGQLGSYLMNAKIWAKSYLWNNSFFYIRGKDSYLGVQTNDRSYSPVKSKNVLDLDLAYISISSDTGNLNLSIGRKFYYIGSGLVLNDRGDGSEVSWTGYGLGLNLVGLYTGLLIKDNNPYKLSTRDYSDGSERAFAGGTANAEFINQKFYVFALVQQDLSNKNSTENTEYNSQYYGTGLEGIIFENFSYFAEFVYETGNSYIDKTDKKSSISAYAVNSEIDYYIPVILKPAITVQYAYGSGDSDRDTYSDSVRPDGSNGKDNGFISFGTYSGGYALKPVLSNIHVFRAGLAIAPFSGTETSLLSKMSVGSKYSYYRKDKKKSCINSGEAELPDFNVGQGIDASLRWQMFYDLSMYVNYGLFLPGKAYNDKGKQNFIIAGINISI